MTDDNHLIAAYETQRKRAFHQSTRGIATPEMISQWRKEAIGALDAVKADAWDEGYARGVRDEAGDIERADNPYREEET